MFPQPGQILEPAYGPWLVALSLLVAWAGSLLALMCSRHMTHRNGRLDWPMAIGAAVSLGGVGIWSMHFIGMVAYQLPVRVTYDVPLTALSLAAAVAISGLALYLAGCGRRFSVTGWLVGSVLAAIGVCVMHYMGMYAMQMDAVMQLDLRVVGASALIAATAAAAALWLAVHVRGFPLQVAAALLMGAAVCSMHYVGMASATMVCTEAQSASGWTINGNTMALTVFGIAGAVLIAIAWLVMGRNMARPESGKPRPTSLLTTVMTKF